jgi:MFS family permease
MLSNVIYSLAVSEIERLAVFALYYVGTAGSAFLGAVFLQRARETKLSMWILSGAVMTALLIALPGNGIAIYGLLSLFMGISLGIGFPSCLAYFSDATTIETRGAFGGIAWGAVGVGTLILVGLVGGLDVSRAGETFLALAIWRALGVVAFFVVTKKAEGIVKAPSAVSYRSILQRREVVLYLLPWIMVSLVNFTEAPILDNLFGNLAALVTAIEFALIGLFALVGGVLADIVGRKRVIITGFVMLGIGYAVLSFSSELPFFRYLYTACDGVAWGMFSSVFLIALWGDLAQDREKEKYYMLGGLPFLLASFLSIIVKPYVEFIGTIASFSLASFFLFLAVLPLMYAPETLPEKRMRDIELKDYLEKAKKAKDKYV